MVIFILGSGRSGTTLLAHILGARKHIFSAGELNYFWDAGIKKNQNCGCGEKLIDCPVWSKVIAETEIDTISRTIKTIKLLKSRLISHSRIFSLLSKFLRSEDYQLKRIEYQKYLTNFYDKLHSITDSRIIVDSSKDPFYYFFLSEIESLKIIPIHIIRDPRAVAFSKTRKKRKKSISHVEEYMPIENYFVSSIKWLLINLFVEFIKLLGQPIVTIKYEDLLQEKEVLLNVLNRNFDIDLHKFEVLDKKYHTALGNPDRISKGEIILKNDDKWKSELSLGKKIWISILTFPLSLKYGYLKYET